MIDIAASAWMSINRWKLIIALYDTIRKRAGIKASLFAGDSTRSHSCGNSTPQKPTILYSMVSISLTAVAPVLASSVSLFFLNSVVSDDGVREIAVDVDSQTQSTTSFPVKLRAKTQSPIAAMQNSHVSQDDSGHYPNFTFLADHTLLLYLGEYQNICAR